ncbi:MAG TPA: CBS domain-containing protein [Polyangia bacterium]|nr:CBS domain-containing protein [Polyangia bacterium]
MRDRRSHIIDLPIHPAAVVPAHLPVGAARKIAALKRAAVLLVESGGRLLGLLDARALAEAPAEATALTVARPVDLGLRPTTSLQRARELLLRARTTALPVAAGAFLLGVIHLADVERALVNDRAEASAFSHGDRAVA